MQGPYNLQVTTLISTGGPQHINVDVIMTTMAPQITSLTVVYSIVYSGADQRKHQSAASLAFVRGIHRDRWIPRTKGQLRGKCFHLMTSSYGVDSWQHMTLCTTKHNHNLYEDFKGFAKVALCNISKLGWSQGWMSLDVITHAPVHIKDFRGVCARYVKCTG